ncbi:MAG: protease inhibitor I42 family protein [Candidatus Thiodiazotropha sp. (ex Dulcina madagascariensis)]|nr:protease inhibitor I42 family protein [Candidatus Thiodiazotropha sp. (ex Dulcina madagascariensis)]MCU7928518.1 protease inhibitor I42 family protein [Candidatus Thiodiazotropha sp. (ex Dulcina madagascariensis)]
MATQERSSLPVVQAAVGESFDIHLQSMQGSTGYGWYLSGLPEGVALLGVTASPVYPGPTVGPTRQTFTFVGLTEIESSLEFHLLAPWKPTEPADHKVFALFIGVEPADELESEMGTGKFVARSAHTVNMPAVIPYGFPDEASLRQEGIVFPLYGFPPPGGGPIVNVIESAENCVLKYGVPGGVADPSHCTLKYGFPVNLAEEAKDILIAYGFPPPTGGGGPVVAAMSQRTPDSGSSGWEMQASDEVNCVVKYGTPGGIATDPADCTVKYGFPVLKD